MPTPVIISDFDGTISIQDVNDTIYRVFGDEISYKIEQKLQLGKTSYREELIRHYDRIKITEAEFRRFIQKNINLDPYFKCFYNMISNNNTTLQEINTNQQRFFTKIFDITVFIRLQYFLVFSGFETKLAKNNS